MSIINTEKQRRENLENRQTEFNNKTTKKKFCCNNNFFICKWLLNCF